MVKCVGILAAWLCVAGCDFVDSTPDYYVCPKDKSEEISDFVVGCSDRTTSVSTCAAAAIKMYCVPGYAPKRVEDESKECPPCECPCPCAEAMPDGYVPPVSEWGR